MGTSVLSCWSFFFFFKVTFFFHENKRQFSQVECFGLSLLRSASARVWQCCLGSSGAGAIPNGFTKLSLEEGDRHWPAHCNQCENPCSWLFITAPNWKQPKCPSAVEWRNKWWCIHTMEYPPAQREPAASQLSIHGWASQTCRVWKKAGTQENTPQDPIYKKHKCRWNSSVVLEVGCWFSWGGRMRTSSSVSFIWCWLSRCVGFVRIHSAGHQEYEPFSHWLCPGVFWCLCFSALLIY